jgi:hypothetical protein
MSEAKKTDSKKSEVETTNTTSGSSSEEQPLLAAAVEKAKYATSEHFVAIRDEARGTIALMPVGWVGEPALVIAEIKLADLKDLLKQL